MNTLFNIPSKIYISTSLPEKTSPGWFILHWVFFVLGFVSLIKAKGGDMPYIFTGMKPFKTLFFWPMVIMFYVFASFKLQIRMTKYTDFVEAIVESGRRGGGLCR